MTVTAEVEAQILRLYHVEKWRRGTIARQLHIHHGTVTRVLDQAGLPSTEPPRRPTKLDPYLPLILETLQKYPTLTAIRLYEMARERGYKGHPDHFRHRIASLRPRPPAEAYLRLRTLAGEQGQVDWGHFGHLNIGRARRPLMAFVMVLSWSRRIFLRFFLDARMENFLRGHAAAFAAWNGCPRILLYDNLRSAVLERHGDVIRYHPTLLSFSAHYRFEVRPVAVARGNEKGRVERSIRYVRDSFFAGCQFSDLDDLNRQADDWCNGLAADRPCPENRGITVRQAFAEEASKLLPLPDSPYPLSERVAVTAAKTPYVRFDLNDYSIPHRKVQRILTVLADPDIVRVVDGAEVIASHHRSYDKGIQIEDPAHLQALIAEKRTARTNRGVDRLIMAVPEAETLRKAAAARADNLGTLTIDLLHLLDCYGAAELDAAIKEALERGVPRVNAVRLALDRRREQRNKPPPIAVELPDHVKTRDVPVRPHRLETYDRLGAQADEGADNDDANKDPENNG